MPNRKLPEGTIALHLENVCEKVGFPSYTNPRKPVNLYGQLKNGTKPSEWRTCKLYWLRRLCKDAKEVQKEIKDITRSYKQRGLGLPQPMDLTDRLKVHKAWFFEGYASGELASLPHLETEIVGLWYHQEKKALEIKIANAVEVNG